MGCFSLEVFSRKRRTLNHVLTRWKKSPWFWGAFVVYALFLISYVPTLVAGRFVVSDSYVFGYNNRVGFLLVLLFTGIAALLLRKSKLKFSTADSSDSVRSAVLWICVAAIVASGIGMYLLTSRLGSFGESTYFINRIELCSRGLRPYRDFEFAYGSFFIYGPLLLTRLLHISIPNAYYLFWIINLGLGTWFLFEVVNGVDFPGRHRNTIFILLFLVTLLSVLCVGLNYTALRFVLAPFSAILIFRVIHDGKIKSQIWGSLLMLFFTAVLILVSPEIAIADALGMLAFMPMFYWRSNRKHWILAYLGALVFMACLFYEANRSGVFSTLVSIGEGGLNFPIIPSPSMLMFLFVFFLGAQQVISALVAGSIHSNYVSVLLVCLPTVAAALGRCDPGHIFWNALILLLIGFLWASGSPIAWKYYSAAFILIFVALGSVSSLWLYRSELGRAFINVALSGTSRPGGVHEVATHLLTRHFGAAAPAKLFKLSALAHQDASSDSIDLKPHLEGLSMAPFGYSVSHNPTFLDFGYYWGMLNVVDSKAVTWKIAELRSRPDRGLLLPEHWEGNCSIAPDDSKKLIQILFMYPYQAHAVHTQSVYVPLCSYIYSHYGFVGSSETNGYQLWSPK